MNADNITTSCCACCGISENDDVKLRNCTACYLVKYCGIKCQKDHRPKHKRVCKKRAAELRDELLFKQPESSSYGDCPICCLPMPFDQKKSAVAGCCGNFICDGCVYANIQRQLEANHPERICPFCRHPEPKTKEEGDRNMMKRAEANDPDALRDVGMQRCKEGDYKSAFEYWTKAVELGNVAAHDDLSIMYKLGLGVEKDKKKEVYHLEQAAIGGHPRARHRLGIFEMENATPFNGRLERAIKHLIIAANFGNDESVETLKRMYQNGMVRKEDFASTQTNVCL